VGTLLVIFERYNMDNIRLIISIIACVMALSSLFFVIVLSKKLKDAYAMIREDTFTIAEMGEQLSRKNHECRALEIGRDEQEENYEMQFLSLNDQIRGLENTLTYQRTDIASLQAQLASKEAVIETHGKKCDEILNDVVNQIIADSEI
jgi:uncharacterized coiled-coil protein SlyX